MNTKHIHVIYATLFCILLGAGNTQAQQEQSLFFMRDLYYVNHSNPAQLPAGKKVFFNVMPGLYLNLSSTGFSFNNIFIERNDSLYLSLDQSLPSLRANNYLQFNLEVDPLSLAIRLNDRFFLTFAYRFRYAAYLNYPKSLLDLAWNGNGNFINETVDIAPDFQLSAWNEFNIGLGLKLSNKVKIGGRVKFLLGAFDISTSQALATAYTDPEIYQLTLATDYRVNSSSSSTIESNLVLGSDSFSINGFNFFPDGAAKLIQPNLGGALDLGCVVQPDDKWRISVSVIDLGAIRWTKGLKNYYGQGEFQYDGLDFRSLLSGDTVAFSTVVDTLQEQFSFAESEEAYTTWLPTKVYIGAEFTPFYKLSFGALLYSEFYKRQVIPALSLSVRKQVGKVFSAGLVYGIRNRRFDNLGINLLVKLGAFQWYVLSDNVFAAFSPFRARNINIRTGIHFAIGKEKKE